MRDLTLGRLRVSAVVERAGPTRPTWLLPDATPEALERHRGWLAPHFLDDKGRLLQSIHAFVLRAPGLTALVDTCVGNDKDRGGRAPFHMMRSCMPPSRSVSPTGAATSTPTWSRRGRRGARSASATRTDRSPCSAPTSTTPPRAASSVAVRRGGSS